MWEEIDAFLSFSRSDAKGEDSHDWSVTWNRPGRTGKSAMAGVEEDWDGLEIIKGWR